MAGTTFGTSVTSPSFVGALTGNVTGNVTGDVTGDVTGQVTGAVVATTLTASGVASLSNASVTMATLPNADPSVAGRLWVDTAAANVVKQSQG